MKMTLEQFEKITDFAEKCNFTSLKYVDFEDFKHAEVIFEDESLVLLRDLGEAPPQIHFATNDLGAMLDKIDVLDLKGLMKFIPYPSIEQFEAHGFKVHCAYQDYFLRGLDEIQLYESTMPESSAQGKKEDSLLYATQEDVSRLTELSMACAGLSRGFFGETDEWFREWLDENEILIKVVDQQIVGFCCISVYAEGTTLWIRELAVHPDYQGRGFARELLKSALCIGQKRGAHKSFLAVDIENSRAIEIYTSFGFQAKENEIEVQMMRCVSTQNLTIRRPAYDEQEKLNAFFEMVLAHTFESNGLSHMSTLLEEEIHSKHQLLCRDFESNGKERHFLVASIGDQIVGTIECGPSNQDICRITNDLLKDVYEIGTVFVHPDFQHRGIGKQMILAIQDTLMGANQKSFCLDSGYPKAQKIWTKTFGEPQYFVENFWGEGAHHMIWHVETHTLKGIK